MPIILALEWLKEEEDEKKWQKKKSTSFNNKND